MNTESLVKSYRDTWIGRAMWPSRKRSVQPEPPRAKPDRRPLPTQQNTTWETTPGGEKGYLLVRTVKERTAAGLSCSSRDLANLLGAPLGTIKSCIKRQRMLGRLDPHQRPETLGDRILALVSQHFQPGDHVSPSWIAATLGKHRGDVNKSITRLVRCGRWPYRRGR